MKKDSPGNRLGAAAFTTLFRAIGILPWSLLHMLAEVIAFLAQRVVKYRRPIVESNLRSSFPEKGEKWVKQTASGFYRHLANYFVETAKMSVMSRRDMSRRLIYEGLEEAEAFIKAGKDVTLMLGHYGNWEWLSSIPAFGSGGYVGAQIYHPLENRAADIAFFHLRSRFGAVSVKMSSTIRTILGWHREGIRSMTGYIADQSPMADDTHLWVDFLNHDTPVFTGAERIARKLRGPVFYIEIFRTGRSRYTARFVKICDDASRQEMFAPTKEYYRLLEQTIRRSPEMWLWSHRRWKRTRADFEARWGDKAAERLVRM